MLFTTLLQVYCYTWCVVHNTLTSVLLHLVCCSQHSYKCMVLPALHSLSIFSRIHKNCNTAVTMTSQVDRNLKNIWSSLFCDLISKVKIWEHPIETDVHQSKWCCQNPVRNLTNAPNHATVCLYSYMCITNVPFTGWGTQDIAIFYRYAKIYSWRVQGKNRRCHICKIVDIAGSSKVRSGHLRFFHGIAFHQRRPQVDWADFSHGTYHGWKLWDVSKHHMRLTPELKFCDISGSSLGQLC